MKIYVGVTDHDWFKYLATAKPDELNFWQPGGKQTFKAIRQNDLFLFKLHSPHNFIVGGGFFIRHSFLPISLAWEAFGNKNGTKDYLSFRNAIHKYRKTDYRSEPDPTIGCIILTMPFFLDKKDWIHRSSRLETQYCPRENIRYRNGVRTTTLCPSSVDPSAAINCWL